MSHTLKDADKAFKKGEEELSTSILKLKFSPDYVSGVTYFETAAKIYEQNKSYDKAILSLKKAITCNKKLLESYAEGQNLLKVAKIYIFYKSDKQTAINYLKESQICFKLAGKYNNSLRIMTELSDELEEKARITNNSSFVAISIEVLSEAWNDAEQFLDDKMIRISIDNLYSKLLDSYLRDTDTYINKAIDLTNRYINILKNDKDSKPYHITNTYAKLIMLRLINKNIEFEDIISNACSKYNANISEDINDLKKLANSIKNRDIKTFNDLICYAYHLFEKNLLKNTKIKFEDHCKNLNLDQLQYLKGDDKNIDIQNNNYDLTNNAQNIAVINISEEEFTKEIKSKEHTSEDFL